MTDQPTAFAEQTSVTGTSLTSFDDAAGSALSRVVGDHRRGGAKAAEVARMWMTTGGVVGHTHYHVELRVLDSKHVESAPSVENAPIDPENGNEPEAAENRQARRRRARMKR